MTVSRRSFDEAEEAYDLVAPIMDPEEREKILNQQRSLFNGRRGSWLFGVPYYKEAALGTILAAQRKSEASEKRHEEQMTALRFKL